MSPFQSVHYKLLSCWIVFDRISFSLLSVAATLSTLYAHCEYVMLNMYVAISEVSRYMISPAPLLIGVTLICFSAWLPSIHLLFGLKINFDLNIQMTIRYNMRYSYGRLLAVERFVLPNELFQRLFNWWPVNRTISLHWILNFVCFFFFWFFRAVENYLHETADIYYAEQCAVRF